MFFDTHCHLNFKAFDGQADAVIKNAKAVGVNQIVIPGTDMATSEKAIAIAEKNEGIYVAIGIHPHHVFEIYQRSKIDPEAVNLNQETDPPPHFRHQNLTSSIHHLTSLLSHPKVVAIGEVGVDRHYYEKTKHPGYTVDEAFVQLQKIFLIEQVKLAINNDKSLILHNREAKEDMFKVLTKAWDKKLEQRTVFHCCEPSKKLLEFAVDHKMFIGVDGDISYYKEKQEFIKLVPLKILVLETDSPYLSPARRFPNEPKNIPVIAELVARFKGITIEDVEKQTTENAKILFNV